MNLETAYILLQGIMAVLAVRLIIRETQRGNRQAVYGWLVVLILVIANIGTA